MIASWSRPSRCAFATEAAPGLYAGGAVQAGLRGAGVVHHFAVDAGKPLWTRTPVRVGSGVLARATVQARFVRAAVVKV